MGLVALTVIAVPSSYELEIFEKRLKKERIERKSDKNLEFFLQLSEIILIFAASECVF
jgi:hypothetical protein